MLLIFTTMRTRKQSGIGRRLLDPWNSPITQQLCSVNRPIFHLISDLKSYYVLYQIRLIISLILLSYSRDFWFLLYKLIGRFTPPFLSTLIFALNWKSRFIILLIFSRNFFLMFLGGLCYYHNKIRLNRFSRFHVKRNKQPSKI